MAHPHGWACFVVVFAEEHMEANTVRAEKKSLTMAEGLLPKRVKQMQIKMVSALMFIFCILLLIISNTMPAYAACQYRVEDVEFNNGIPFFRDKPLNGVLCFFNENGGLESEYSYKNGKVEGLMKSYYESGKLYFEIPYKNGKKEGMVKTYYENGKLRSQFPFKNDKSEGWAKLYYGSGKLRSEALYKDNRMEGLEKTYHENGKLQLDITYKNDSAVSGTCHLPSGKRRPLTSTEIANWNNGLQVDCP